MKILGVFLERFRRQPQDLYLDFISDGNYAGCHDANKNDVLDAMCYALFGDYPNSRRNNSYGTKKNGYYVVRVYILDHGTTYSFTRFGPTRENPLKLSISPFQARVTAPDNSVKLYKGGEAEEVRRQVVGSSKIAFLGSFFLQGKENDAFLSGPANKETVFLQAFGPEKREQAISALKEASTSIRERRSFLKKNLENQCRNLLAKAKEVLPLLPSELIDAKALIFNGVRSLQPLYEFLQQQQENASALLEEVRQLRLEGLKKMSPHTAQFQKFLGSNTNRDPLHIGTTARRVVVYTRYLTVAEEMENVNGQIQDMQKMISLFDEFHKNLSTAKKKMREQVQTLAEEKVDANSIDSFDVQYAQLGDRNAESFVLEDPLSTKTANFFNAKLEKIHGWPEPEAEEQPICVNKYLHVDAENTWLLPKDANEYQNFGWTFSFIGLENQIRASLMDSLTKKTDKEEDDYVAYLDRGLEVLSQLEKELEQRTSAFQEAKADLMAKYDALMQRKETFLLKNLSTKAVAFRLAALRKELDKASVEFSKEEETVQSSNMDEKEKKLALKPAVINLERTFQDILARCEEQVKRTKETFKNFARFLAQAREIYAAINRIQNALDVCDVSYSTAIEMLQKLTGKSQFANALRRVKNISPIAVSVREMAKDVLEKASLIYSELVGKRYYLLFEEPTETRDISQCFDIVISEDGKLPADSESEDDMKSNASIDNLPPKESQLVSFALTYALNVVYRERYGEVFRETMILDQFDDEITEEQRNVLQQYVDEMSDVKFIYMPPNRESWFTIHRTPFSLKLRR